MPLQSGVMVRIHKPARRLIRSLFILPLSKLFWVAIVEILRRVMVNSTNTICIYWFKSGRAVRFTSQLTFLPKIISSKPASLCAWPKGIIKAGEART